MMMNRRLPQYVNSLVIINYLVVQLDGIQNGQILVIVNASSMLQRLFGKQGDDTAYITNTKNPLSWGKQRLYFIIIF